MLDETSETPGAVLALVADRTPAAMIVQSPDGRILSWNRGAEQLLRHTRVEAVGQYAEPLLVPPGQQDVRREALRQAGESGSACYEGERRHKDGSVVPVLVLVDVLRGGNGSDGLLVETLRDRRRVADLGHGPRDADTTTLLGSLTARQRDVLRGFGEGQSTIDIALGLKLSPKTIETHRAHLMKRLRVRNLAGIVRFAIRAGVVTP